jgi:predicted negative regulator of RcsB-dependent stress response|uniref:Ancillary SecYEG translocon subunit n=1 Tax=Hydrogenobacter sp. TaxID=2152829 RepID=A0A7C2V6M3_9AQUI
MKDIVLRVGGLIAVVLLFVGGFLLWDKYKKDKLEKLAYKEYEVSKLIQTGNYPKALELIKSNQSSGPFKSLFLSYELYIAENSEEKIDEGKVLNEILESLKDKDLLALYRERYAYYLFKQGKLQEALKELEKVEEKDFNYVSALLLKAQILKKQGKNKEAQEALSKAKEKSPNTYFSNMAQAMMLMGR